MLTIVRVESVSHKTQVCVDIPRPVFGPLFLPEKEVENTNDIICK